MHYLTLSICGIILWQGFLFTVWSYDIKDGKKIFL